MIAQFINISDINQFYTQMSVIKKLKELLLKCDLFKTTQFFRYQQQPEYRTMTGSICSIIIVIIFVSIFATAIIGTFQKNTITWNYGLTQQTSQQFTVTTGTHSPAKFMFAVGINNFNLVSGDRYFDFVLQQHVKINGADKTYNISLQPCNRDDWVGSGSAILEVYDRLNFNNFLCPPVDQSFNISGTLTSQSVKYVHFEVSKCSNFSSDHRPCVNSTILQQYLLNAPNFQLNFYFVNGLINPSSPNQITFYLQDRNYVPFNFQYGGAVNLYMSKYLVTTDEQILPNQVLRSSQGGIVNYLGQYIASRVFKDVYASVNIKKSSLSLNIQRQYIKLDSTLSYIGGLFGFIMIMFIFMRLYTQYSFEIEMGDRLYYYDKKDPLNSQKFNFLSFIAYAIYNLLASIGLDFKWQMMKKYQECQQQIQQQFDICFLMKRLIFFQRSLKILFEDHQFKGLHMHQKLTLKQAHELREFYQLREHLLIEEEVPSSQKVQKGKKDSNQSAQMNITQNVMQNNQEIEDYFQQKHRKENQTRKYTDLEMGKKHENELKNESKISIEGTLKSSSNIQSSNVGESWQSKIKLLRQQSQSGNLISKKIYQGFNSDLIKSILLKIEEDQDQLRTQHNKISINENQDNFQIRISKRPIAAAQKIEQQIAELCHATENDKESQGEQEKSIQQSKNIIQVKPLLVSGAQFDYIQ